MLAPLVFALTLLPLTPADDEQAGSEQGDSEQGEDEAAEDADEDDGRWGLNVVPRFALSSDDGVGLGLRGTAFWYRWGQKPYKTAISFQAFATTRLVQHHYLRVDAVDAFNIPLRLGAAVGYFQTLSANYCGLASEATCDDAQADRAFVAFDDGDVDRGAFLDRYHQARFLMPYANATARLRLSDKPRRPDVFVSYNARWYVPGTLFDDDGDGELDLHPYAGSRFAEDHPDGQPGLASIVQLGFSLDDRDFEPDPTRGFYLETSVRGSAPLIASNWIFGGANATAKLYVPMTSGLTLATRLLVDLLFGDVPYFEAARTGGTEEEWAIGGSDVGRGIRQQRYAGKVKAAFQIEARARLYELEAFSQRLVFVLAPFVDTGFTLDEPTLALASAPRLLWGGGLALRVAWNDAFVMRIDAASSPEEGFVPSLYTLPDHPF